MPHESPPPTAWPTNPRRGPAAASHGSTRARRGSTRRTGSSRPPRARDPQPVASEDWLRDNHHVVQDQVREIRQDLPRSYYLELPKLADGPLPGLPARLPARPRADRAHRRPGRSRHARRLRHRVSAHVAALDRRDLGDPDHAAARARRGAAPARRRRRRAPGAAARRRGDGTTDWPAARTGPSATDRPAPRGRPAGGRPAVGGVRRRAAAMAARPAVHGGAGVAGAAARAAGAGRLGRRDAADRAPARGGRPARDRQRDHEHAALSSIDWTLFFERVSLVEQLLRDDPAGAYALMDFSDARPLPPFGRAARQARAAGRRPTSPRRAIELARTARARRAAARPPASRRLLPDLPRPLPPGARRRLPADAARAARAVRVPAPGASGISAAIAASTVAERREPARVRGAPRRDRRRAAGSSRSSSCSRSASWSSACST